jgi:beta-galactosidase GanA
VGVEYYRTGSPKQDVWDEDFARIRAAGFTIVRSASYWNWMEPVPGEYQLDDYDMLLELAQKHGLSVWLDTMLATHGACPEWLTRRYPDMRVVNYRGRPHVSTGHPAYPQGGMIHCYDHPAWREHGGALLRHVVNRYKDHPSLHIWGIWDGIALSSQWVRQDDGYPCYCDNSLARYATWLQENFSLDEFNACVSRRYRRWEEVEPPRSDNNVVEMLLFRRFHYENLAGHLKWMIGEVRALDEVHETRTHGGWIPRPWDETCAEHADSWGMSMQSNMLLTSDDPYKLAERAFSFDWSRAIGRNGRWWNEEIYSGMSPGGVTWKKQTDPRELTTLLWMTLAHGAAGAMFWQYRPDYFAFEAPGYNLVALNGQPTPRFEAVTRAISEIDALRDHLPLECPRAEVAVVNHQTSHELFNYNEEGARFLADLRGIYRALWEDGVPVDVVTPRTDWSGYRLVFLPNVTLMTDEVLDRIAVTLDGSPDTRLVAAGSFGMYSKNGMSSYNPPEGFAETLGVRVADFSQITELDIERGANTVETPYGPVKVSSPSGYAVLEPLGGSEPIASLDGKTIAIKTADGRLAWYGLSLLVGAGGAASPQVISGLVKDAGIQQPLTVEGGRVVPIVRRSRQGGRLIFLFNLEPQDAKVSVRTNWNTSSARDLLRGVDLESHDNTFDVVVDQWSVAVLHCPEG